MNRIKEFWNKSFTDWRARLALHAGFWFLYLFYSTRESFVINVNPHQHIIVILTGVALSLFLYYPLVYIIVPLVINRRWVIAVLLYLGYYMIAVVFRDYYINLYVSWYNNRGIIWFQGEDFWKRLQQAKMKPSELLILFFSTIPSLLQIIFEPLVIKFFRYTYLINVKSAWLAKENSKLQLDTLRAQLNPHFFFNTLNNLQSYIVQNEREKSVDLLSKLADFMRSSLYDCDEDHVTMEQEIKLLNNYIEIERIRFETSVAIDVTMHDADPRYRLPAFILLPFVENVFKHGGDLPADNIFMEIELLNEPDQFRFQTKNSYRPRQAGPGGIGLQNVRTRLDYYFPGKHVLKVEQDNRFYQVTLSICKV